MNVLGLDIGSSTIKGAVLDLRQGAVRNIVREHFPHAIAGLPAGFYEIDPLAVATAAARVIDRLVHAEPSATALFVTGQMGGIVLVNRTGDPVTNYLSWRDQRSRERHPSGVSYLQAIRARWTDREFAELGSELQAGSATSLLFWLAEQRQLPPNVIPATIADFAIARLCQTLPRMHSTHALGLLNLSSGTWHTTALAALGLVELAWPELDELQGPIGTWESSGKRLPCYVALGDQQCALRGAGLQEGELSLNVSTGSQVSRRTSSLELGPYQTRPYFDGAYLNTITHLPAGRSLNVLVDLLTELARAHGVTLDKAWDYIAKAAAGADGGGLACDLAFFAGPLGDRGSVRGISTENLTVGNLFHAALVNMADNYAACADRLWPDRGWKQIALSGGLSQSLPVLRTLIEQRFAAPIRESVATEETLLGLLDVARPLAGVSRE